MNSTRLISHGRIDAVVPFDTAARHNFIQLPSIEWQKSSTFMIQSTVSINCLYCQLHSNDDFYFFFMVECGSACFYHSGVVVSVGLCHHRKVLSRVRFKSYTRYPRINGIRQATWLVQAHVISRNVFLSFSTLFIAFDSPCRMSESSESTANASSSCRHQPRLLSLLRPHQPKTFNYLHTILFHY